MPATKRAGRPSLPDPQVRAVRRALQELLEEHNGNGSAVARILGLTQSAVSQLKAKRNRPSVATAQAIAKARGVDVSVLLAGGA